MRPVEFSSESIISAGQDLQATGRNITYQQFFILGVRKSDLWSLLRLG